MQGITTILEAVSLGIAVGDRIGVVGRNGAGKTTLLDVLTKAIQVDGGRVTHTGGLRIGVLRQADDLRDSDLVQAVVVGAAAEHHWRGDGLTRSVLSELGVDPLLDRAVGTLSGGERRRVALARLLIADLDLLILDEPTNHLDVEGVAWLAAHLASGQARHRAFVAVTHDRWFLDETATVTWEVAGASVHAYPGGYSAYVLARAERQRQADASESRRRNLVRKELAWLRRGAPARTSKPRYRIDAANALIAQEPPVRDSAALQQFSSRRLGRSVYDLEDAFLELGGTQLLAGVTWRLGPGDRVALIGVNGAGKTTLLRILAGEQALDAGALRVGVTVAPAFLSQQVAELPVALRVLEAVEDVARVLEVNGEQVTASQLLERFGFAAARQWTPVGDLSGGERRRLQLLRLLMSGPNVLVLDEPTNDLDVDTLVALEDLLDGWAGTLVVVSHDRWFLERVCDSTVALVGDGSLAALPGGVEEYLARRASTLRAAAASGASSSTGGDTRVDERSDRREVQRIEKTLERLDRRASTLHEKLAAAGADYSRAVELDGELRAVLVEKSDLEEQWLTVSERLSERRSG